MARELVTVARFDIPANAYIARNALEEEGIRSVLQDEQLVAMDYLLNLAVGGIKLQVWDEDAERAVAVLEGLPPAVREPETAEPNAVSQSRDNARDRYAQRAIWATLWSILVASVVFYLAYLLLMALFSEGTLTGARRWGVWVAALVTPVVMGLSLVWFLVAVNLITTGRVEP